MKTTTSIATILAFLLVCDVLHAFSSPRSKRPLPQQRPAAHRLTKAAFIGVCSAAVAVGITCHPLPAQATLSQDDLENIGKLMEENNLKLETKLGLYPIATVGIAVVANVVGILSSSNKLDDTLKRFDEKREGIKAELEKDVDAKSFLAGVIGGSVAASAVSSVFLLVLVGTIYRMTGDAGPT